MTYYNHPAVEAPPEPGDKGRECFVCGAAVTGVGETLTHWDEQVRTIPVDREYLPAVRAATETVTLALSKVTERATDAERARVASVALYEAGYLRKRPVKP